GTQVPIINTKAAEQLQIDLLRNHVPVYRADGDADFLGPLFKKQQQELQSGKRDLETEIARADLRYGELFNSSASHLKELEGVINSQQALNVIHNLPQTETTINNQLIAQGKQPISLSVEKFQI